MTVSRRGSPWSFALYSRIAAAWGTGSSVATRPFHSTLSVTRRPPAGRSSTRCGRRTGYCTLSTSLKMKSKGPSRVGTISSASPRRIVTRSASPASFRLTWARSAISSHPSMVVTVPPLASTPRAIHVAE